MRKRNGRFLALVMAVAMAVTNVDVYSLRVSAEEYAGESAFVAGTTDAEDSSENQTGTPSSETGLVDIIAGDVQTESADAMYSAENEGSEEYLIDDTVGFTVTDVTVDAGSYVAEVNVSLEQDDETGDSDTSESETIRILYTIDENAAFFKGATFVSSEDFGDTYEVGGYGYYYSGESNTSLTVGGKYNPLHPNTTYIYRLVLQTGYIYDEEKHKEIYTYCFLSKPNTFTTAAPVETPSVTVGDISVEEYGYDTEIILANINNPNGELTMYPEIFKKGTKDSFSTTYYTWENEKWAIPTNIGDLELCVGVYTGEGEITYVRKEIPFKYQDSSGRKIDITADVGSMTLSATATLEPWYELDRYNYRTYLYYKKDTDSSYTSATSRFSTYSGTGMAIALPSYALAENQNYQYYIQVKDAAGNVLANEGSETEPLTFKTGELITYTEEDFADKSLYALLVRKYGNPLTNAKLDKVRDFSSVEYLEDSFASIATLEDIPKVLPNLVTIDMPGKNISDIKPLKQMPLLKSVKLSYNDVAELPDLSDCAWTILKLDYNYLKTEDIDSTKLPPNLTDKNITGGNYRSDTVKCSDVCYIDNDGKYPLVFSYDAVKGNYRQYTTSVTIGEKTKVYTNEETRGGCSQKAFVISDMEEDFDLIKGQKYQVRISVEDQFGISCVTDKEIMFEDAPDIVDDIYVSPAKISVHCENIAIAGVYTDSQIKAVSVARDGEKLWIGSVTGSYSTNRSVRSLYYDKSIFANEIYYIYSADVNYQYTRIYYTLDALKILPAGDYDLVIEMEDGTTRTYTGKFHMADTPVVASAGVHLDDYDNTGDYYFVRLVGLNLAADRVWPIITDAYGTEYTTLVEMNHVDSDSYALNTESYDSYVYKLKKGDNWGEIEKASESAYYYIKLGTTGDVIDLLSDNGRKVTAGYLLNNSSDSDLHPVNAWYNWKKQTVEMAFKSVVPQGTEITMSISKGSQGTILATASGKTDEKGRLSLIPRTTDGSVYSLADGGYELKLTADGKASATYYFDVKWYNYYSPEENYSVLFLNLGSGYYEEGTNKISATAYGNTDLDFTDGVYYAKLFDDSGRQLAQSGEWTYDKNVNRDVFSIENWNFGKELSAGYYQIRLYESVNGVESTLAWNGFRVLKDIENSFYQYQSVRYDRSDASKADFTVRLPFLITQSMSDADELKAFVAEHGFKVEVFNRDKGLVDAVAEPASTTTNADITYRISGLNADELGYYFRFTCDGQTGIDIYSGTSYYSDEESGKWHGRSASSSITYSREKEIYTGIGTSEFEGDFPYTLQFYELGDRGSCVHSLTIDASKLNSYGQYIFTTSDLAGLLADEIYYCVITSNRGIGHSWAGYFVPSGTITTIAVQSVTVTGAKNALKPQETLQLQALISPADATNKSVTWSSSNEAVAAVDKNGLVTAVAPGTAEIIVKTADGGKTAAYAVTVAEDAVIAVEAVSILGGDKTLRVGETARLQAIITPDNATDQNVTWSSSNEAIATIDESGVITAVAAGTAEITVTTADGGKTASFTLTVQDNDTGNTASVESVSITGRKSSIKEGETMQLQAIITPENATDKSVTWSSSNPSVATVDANGLVKAVAVGTTEITVTTMDGGRKAAFTLKVINLDTANSLHVEFADGMEFTYTGEKIMPAVTVYYQGKALAQDVDYTVSYINNVNASQDGAKVIVTGKTIAANATTNFTITRKNLNDPDIKAGTILVTSGSKAAPALYYGSYKLSAKDYINPDATKKFTENGSITLEGKGNFTGRRVLPVSVVEKGQLGKFKVEFKAKARTYNGEAQYLQDGELTARDAQSKNPLVENTDYVIVYPQNVTSAGTVKFTILGIGAYTGSVSKSYKIAPAKKAQSDFSVEIAKTVAYRQGGVTPGVTVYSEGSLLSAGRDYKVKYSANKKIGTAKYTITFQGNYKGSAKLKGTFEIKAASLNKAKVAVPDKAFLKAGKYISTPYVSVDGMALSKKDYTIKYMLGGKELTAKDTITEDMLQGGSAEITVVVTGKGNYDSATSATGTYHVSKTTADYDLSKAKVEIRDKSTGKKVSAFAFTGDEIKIDRQYEIYVTIGKSQTVLREGVDFTATYANNVNKGRATIILNGLGANSSQNTKYYGSKTAGFSIVRGIMNWL